MAEVTVWIEEDGTRVSYTAEEASKSEAMRKAKNFLTALLAGDEAKRELNGSVISSATPIKVTPAGREAIEQLRKAVRKSADSYKVIKFAEELGYELTTWQKEMLRGWFNE
ncbi:hypothetical protein V6U89_29795 [Micromonospora sp. CPCC 206171]|uniref:hypothetical protein n=1 Tax=Micromonospora sp. CPCC 206171 TaxID=3122405 RepID=UPI002FF2FE9B